MLWMQTATGRRFDLDECNADQVDAEDIVAALPFIPCFTGAQRTEHEEYPYSVAQHCLLVARLVSAELAFDALMHDAWKAYIGDFSKPLSSLLNSISEGRYQATRERIQRAVAIKFGLKFPLPDAVEIADQIARATECRDILASSREPWSQSLPAPCNEVLIPLPTRIVRRQFHDTLCNLWK